MGSGAFSVNASGRGGHLFGPSMLIHKQTYFAAGGHETVRGRILENFFFSDVLAGQGVECRCFLGRGTLSFRMFPEGFGQMRKGWIKAFASGAGGTSPWLLLGSIVWLSGMATALLCIFLARPPIGHLGVLFYVLFAVQIYGFQRRVGKFGIFTALFYPLFFIFYQAVFAVSLWRLKVGAKSEWRGRKVFSDHG